MLSPPQLIVMTYFRMVFYTHTQVANEHLLELGPMMGVSSLGQRDSRDQAFDINMESNISFTLLHFPADFHPSPEQD